MAHGDIADRQIGLLPDGSAQPLAIGQAAAGVGDQHRLAPDDETDIGDGIVIAGAGILIDAAPDMEAGRHFFGGEGTGAGCRRDGPQGSGQAAETKPAGQGTATRQGRHRPSSRAPSAARFRRCLLSVPVAASPG